MRVESIPEPGKLPLSFETVKPLTARAEWNILLPEHNQSQKVGDGMTGLLLQGANTQLQPGERQSARPAQSRRRMKRARGWVGLKHRTTISRLE